MRKELKMIYLEEKEEKVKEDRIIQKLQPKKAVEIAVYNPTQINITNTFKRLKKHVKNLMEAESKKFN